MANFTKRAIMESFLDLIEERPLSKITVKDITDYCDLNRNTFYYHFQDIPQLIEAIVCEDAEFIISSNPQLESLEQCLDVALSFALKRKNFINHICQSTERAIFEHFLWETCESVITSYYNMAFSDVSIKEADRKLIIDYYKCLCFGFTIYAIDQGFQENMRPMIHRIFELKKNSVEDMVNRCIKDDEG